MGGPRPGIPGIAGAAAAGGAGGFGAAKVGTWGAECDGAFSESEAYEASAPAPVSMFPPRFFSFGMPPANRPASCGAESAGPEFCSLLLRARFPGTGGARPGTGGALPAPTTGAERSLVAVFLRAFPLLMSASREF